MLGGGGGGVEGLLDAVGECDGDLRREIIGAALHLDLTTGVGLFGLARVALRQELHARRQSRVQRVEFDSNLGQKLQHFLLFHLPSVCRAQRV